MEELGKDARGAASAADETELKQQEMDEVTGGNDGGCEPVGPHRYHGPPAAAEFLNPVHAGRMRAIRWY